MEISLCMIVKNEENCLANCLDSVCDLVDEIVIVDTGSTDKTKEIAARYTDKIYDFEWINDFSAARNFAFSKGTKDYLMWLDADDIITEENRKGFLALKKSLGFKFDIISMYYTTVNSKGATMDKFYRERLIKRKAGFQWEDKIHEYIDLRPIPSNKKYSSTVTISHTKPGGKSNRNLEILEEIIKQGEPSLRMLFNYASELALHERIEESIRQFELFFEKGGTQADEVLYGCTRLCNLYVVTNQYEKIEDLFQICAARCDDRSEYCCCRANFYQEIKKDIDKAVYWYEKATKCTFESAKFQYALEQYYYYIPYYNLGQLYASQNRLEEAKRCLQRALDYLKKTQIVNTI